MDKSKSLLRGIIYGVCALVLVAGGVGIYAWQTNAKKDRVEGENAQLNKLVMEGAKLGRSRLFDSKSLGACRMSKSSPMKRMPHCFWIT